MLLAAFLLLRVAAEPKSPVILVPAPGAPPVEIMKIDGEVVRFDAAGRARVAKRPQDSAEFRFYTPDGIDGSSTTFYFQSSLSFIRIQLPAIKESKPTRARLVVKPHSASDWAAAKRFDLPLELLPTSTIAPFACAGGEWDLAILVDGYAPVLTGLHVGSRDTSLSVERLAPSATLRGRVLDARSGRPPSRWTIHVSRIANDPTTPESVFFKTYPIARDQDRLEYRCLPIGGWELAIEVSGVGTRRTMASALKAGAVVDLGDVFVAGTGSLKVAISFPKQLPTENVVVTVSRPAPRGQERPSTPLASQTVTPAPAVAADFADLDPGPVEVETNSASGALKGAGQAIVAANEIATVDLMFSPLRIHGTIRRGQEAVAQAKVAISGQNQRVETSSKEQGDYEAVVWTRAPQFLIVTMPPGDETVFPDLVRADADADDLEHDVLLPANTIQGTVRDADSGEPLSDVKLQATTIALPGPGGDDEIHISVSRETDAMGRFEFRNLRAAPMDVSVSKDDYAKQELSAVIPAEPGPDLDIRLSRGTTLTGVVVEPDGAPVADAKVGLDLTAGGVFFATTTRSGAGGEFQFKKVSSGPHRVTAMKCGHVIATRTVMVKAETQTGDPASPETWISAPAGNPIQVRFQDASGAPIAGVTARWVVNGDAVPLEEWGSMLVNCGQSPFADAEGKLTLSGLPAGSVTALSLADQQPLGTFQNDGSEGIWTIRIPEGVHERAPESRSGSR